MNPDTIPEQIAAFHRLYESLTHARLTLDWTRLDVWRVFIGFRKPSFTHADLNLVISYLRKNRKGQVLDGSLKFHNLIGRPDYFEEDLSIALQAGRPTPPRTKTIQCNGTSRIVADPGTSDSSVSVAEVIRRMREAAEGRF